MHRLLCAWVMYFLFPSLKSTLGYVALLISTFHVLIYGWKRAFAEEYYRFYTPPNFVLALVLPSIVILGKTILLLPCLSRKLKRIKKGWERSQFLEEGLGGTVPHLSPERVTVMWRKEMLMVPYTLLSCHRFTTPSTLPVSGLSVCCSVKPGSEISAEIVIGFSSSSIL